jgi:glycosyltransferase involved in cell wall biosynthesis
VQDSQADLPARDFFIVAPVLDEAGALPALLAELEDAGLLGRTLFVDNGSTDGSAQIIAAAGGLVLREPRRGYGYPCLTGARAAAARGARAVVFMEADGTDDPAQVRHLVGPILSGAADLVVGERRTAVRPRATRRDRSAACSPTGPDATGRMPLHQRLGNDWLALSLRLLFGLRVSDDGPFRAVRLDLLARLRLEERAYAFPTEMLVKAHLLGARIVVRETRYRPRAGRSKIAGTARGTFGAVRDITWCLVRLRLLGFHADP